MTVVTRWFIPALIAALSFFGAMAGAGATEPFTGGDAEAGRRLYWDGTGADGQPISGLTQGDIRVSGAQFSCLNCHRPSGFGSSEGGNYVPPITAPILFSPRKLVRNRLFKEFFQEVQPDSFWARVRQPRMRPGYDGTTLARALRDGLDSSGAPLHPIMPRYDLADTDVANLMAFLKTLSTEFDEGVGQTDIHFATVFTADADPAARKAVLETMEVFFKWMNKDTEGDTHNPSFSPYYRSAFIGAYRYWRLHVWDLEGPPETWGDQLAASYAEQPVFAVVSGLVKGPWAPIGDFCDAKRMPCLFPNTELPRTSDARYGYSLYFNRGLELEAEALLMHLADTAPPGRVLQIRAPGPDGEIPAIALEAYAAIRLPQTRVDTIEVADPGALTSALAAAEGANAPDVVVIWPGDPAAAIADVARLGAEGPDIYLPSAALGPAIEILPVALQKRVRFVWPYERPDAYHPRKFRVRAWMHTRRLAVTHDRLQRQTYYALTLLQYGLQHALEDFYRDYLIELIEHEAENELNPGTHPSLALGPGQRFASKGAFLAEVDPSQKRGYRTISGWIVP